MLDKHFDFTSIENKFSQKWLDINAFAPDMQAQDSFSIMMPPPNVTGTLHLGHALDNTLPDILVRRARMQGKATIYQPGFDHASIAVHVVLERKLRAEDGLSRFDVGREEFLKRSWAWKEESRGLIVNQMQKLGISCDWGNERFTMDDNYSKAVNKVFVALYNQGLIYRGQRLVNWDPVMQTAVSDLEVTHKEVHGHLWHFKYPYVDGFTYEDEKTGVNDGIVIATTRPETILADGAIAINPKDPRAKSLVGKFVNVPIVNRKIPIIMDDYVDTEFGSGMVKITAAHDFNDFEVYKRNKDKWDIPLINLMTPEAKMNENCPDDYVGLDRFDARLKVIADFKEMGLFVKEVPHTNNVGHAERDDIILEPYLTNQWYVKGKPLADKVLKALNDGDVKFVNERDNRVMRHWLNNIQDWCISRQLWWGHQVPVWTKGDETYVGEGEPEGDAWVRDTDILDTWFSSALWPFATQGWPIQESEIGNQKSEERLKKFYPSEVIMTGRDILFFWDVRMMMMSLELHEKAPFKTIYTHGLIMDEDGQKMSKSKGNVLDPMDMVEKYGADALRLTMASIASAEDMRFSEQKVEQNRNFCTKIWNAARFMEMNGIRIEPGQDALSCGCHDCPCMAADEQPLARHPINLWLIGELKQLFIKTDKHLDKYEFNRAAYELYHFTWDVWCDWYLELTKPLLNDENSKYATETKKVMGWGFGMLLRALSPFIPYITEELWQGLTGQTEKHLMLTKWPEYSEWMADKNSEAEVKWLIELITNLRVVRTESKVPPKAKIKMLVKGCDAETLLKIEKNMPFLNSMAGIEGFESTKKPARDTDVTAIVKGVEYILPLADIVDFAAEKERVQKEIIKIEEELAKINSLLDNANFVKRAPEKVIIQNRDRCAELSSNISKLREISEG